jgi:hypothetical protein
MQTYTLANYKHNLVRAMYCIFAEVRVLCQRKQTNIVGRAVAQSVSRPLPTAAARVQTRVWSCGIL